MPLFRKKPVTITAMQFRGPENGYDVLHWANEQQHKAGRELVEWINSELIIPTLEGTLIASVGDWIILGVKGEVYPCKPDIFAMTYEEVITEPQVGTET